MGLPPALIESDLHRRGEDGGWRPRCRQDRGLHGGPRRLGCLRRPPTSILLLLSSYHDNPPPHTSVSGAMLAARRRRCASGRGGRGARQRRSAVLPKASGGVRRRRGLRRRGRWSRALLQAAAPCCTLPRWRAAPTAPLQRAVSARPVPRAPHLQRAAAAVSASWAPPRRLKALVLRCRWAHHPLQARCPCLHHSHETCCRSPPTSLQAKPPRPSPSHAMRCRRSQRLCEWRLHARPASLLHAACPQQPEGPPACQDHATPAAPACQARQPAGTPCPIGPPSQLQRLQCPLSCLCHASSLQ